MKTVYHGTTKEFHDRVVSERGHYTNPDRAAVFTFRDPRRALQWAELKGRQHDATPLVLAIDTKEAAPRFQRREQNPDVIIYNRLHPEDYVGLSSAATTALMRNL